jgi:uncharacterized protein (DUF433 family)
VRFLEINPDVQGGEPVICGTRIPIRGLAKQIEAGESPEVLRTEYPYIDPDAFEFAVRWARENPRPSRPPHFADEPTNRPEPAARAALLARRRAARGE